MLKHFLLILFFFISLQSFAQTDSLTDSSSGKKIPLKQSTQKIDSAATKTGQQNIAENDSSLLQINDSAKLLVNDSLQNDSNKVGSNITRASISKHLSWQEDTAYAKLFKIGFKGKIVNTVFLAEDERKVEPKDILFYVLVGLVLFLALIKTAFSKYFYNIFRSFSQVSFRQKQTREVLLQNNLPSLLTNILFFLSGGLFIALVGSDHGWINISFWWLCLYCTGLLAAVYAGKFLFIRFSGWVFRAEDAANNYIFIVFLVNKIIGILFIPLLMLLAFADTVEANTLVTIGGSVCILLLLYRYIMILSFLRAKLKISPFHFFIYLCTVEILPMLVIFKVLFNKINIVF